MAALYMREEHRVNTSLCRGKKKEKVGGNAGVPRPVSSVLGLARQLSDSSRTKEHEMRCKARPLTLGQKLKTERESKNILPVNDGGRRSQIRTWH